MQIRLEPIPPMPDELKEAIKAEGGRAVAGRVEVASRGCAACTQPRRMAGTAGRYE